MSKVPPTPTGDLTVDMAKAVGYLPRFLAQWALGLILIAITDYVIFTFVVTAVAAGFTTGSIWIGALTFFGLFSLYRVAGTTAEYVAVAIKQAGGAVQAGVMSQSRQYVEVEQSTE